MQVLVVTSIIVHFSGLRSILISMLVILALTWAVEFIGSNSGIPFGPYHYTDRLQPPVYSVPILVPLAWWMMLPASWAVAGMIIGKQFDSRPLARRSVIAMLLALAFTAWDLFLDPQMVAWDLWAWEQPGGYFGIPLMNYLGWLLVSFTLNFLFMPRELPLVPLYIIYMTNWILQTIGQVAFWNLPGSAIVGFLGMGMFEVLAFFRRRYAGITP